MGISISFAAVTTFISSFWLIFPIFMFYRKFAILVMTTSAFSLLFALFFYMALLAICGPNGTTGYIFNLCKKCRKHDSDKSHDQDIHENGNDKKDKVGDDKQTNIY